MLVVPNNINSYTARRKKHQMSKTCWPTGPSCLNPLAISIRLQNLLLWVKWRGCKSYTSLWDSGKKNRIQRKDLHSMAFTDALCNPQQIFCLFVCTIACSWFGKRHGQQVSLYSLPLPLWRSEQLRSASFAVTLWGCERSVLTHWQYSEQQHLRLSKQAF